MFSKLLLLLLIIKVLISLPENDPTTLKWQLHSKYHDAFKILTNQPHFFGYL